MTDYDWIDTHLRGMALLRADRLDEAIDLFQLGVEQGPAFKLDCFRAGLSLARLRAGLLDQVAEQLDRIESPRLLPAANVVRLRVCARRGDRAGTERAARALADQGPAVCIELTEELRRRYLAKQPARHSDQRLHE